MTLLSLLSSEGLHPETMQLFSSTSKKKGKSGSKGGAANEEEPKADFQPVIVHLHFKRYVFDPHKKMVQSWPSLTPLSDAAVAAVAAGSVRGLLEGRCAQALQIRDMYFSLVFPLFGWRPFTEMLWLWTVEHKLGWFSSPWSSWTEFSITSVKAALLFPTHAFSFSFKMLTYTLIFLFFCRCNLNEFCLATNFSFAVAAISWKHFIIRKTDLRFVQISGLNVSPSLLLEKHEVPDLYLYSLARVLSFRTYLPLYFFFIFIFYVMNQCKVTDDLTLNSLICA